MKKHAYLILAHNEFQMLYYLLQALDDQRNDIYLHIDRRVNYVNEKALFSYVKKANLFLVKRKRIFWGHRSMVDVELQMLKEATKRDHYHYYHLISGTDVPLKTQEEIHELLSEADDNYVSYHRDGEFGDHFLWKIKYYHPLIRIVGRGIFPGDSKREKLLRYLGKIQWHIQHWQEQHNVDRCKKYKDTLFKGDQWFSITDSLARDLVKDCIEIKRRYRFTNTPDEFMVPTYVMNSIHKSKTVNSSKRYIDWNRGNPYEFQIEDYDELVHADAIFARKVSMEHNPELVRRLYKRLKIQDTDENKEEKSWPLVSIIVPIYNVEKYLECCLSSIAKQNYRNVEVILVNDGSTDKSGSIAKSFADEDERFLCLEQKNRGLSAARNMGLKYAQGDYICFVDSDDWIHEDYVKSMVICALKKQVDIVACGFKYMAEQPGEIKTFDEEIVLSRQMAMSAFSNIFRKEALLMAVVWNKLYKRALFEKNAFTEGMIHEDEMIAHRLIDKAEVIAVMQEPYYYYRVRNDSITSAEKEQDVRHLDIMKAQGDRLICCRDAMYQNIWTNMVYSYFENLTLLCMRYNEASFKKYHLNQRIRRMAWKVYVKDGGVLPKGYKKEIRKMMSSPWKYKRYIKGVMDDSEG